MRMASYEAHREGAVRIGPVSVITLLVVVCLAVLAVLSFSTARANSAEAARQADNVTSTYSNEFAAWEFVQTVDEQLYKTAKAGGGLSDAMEAIRAVVPESAVVGDASVKVAFTTDNERLLNVELAIEDDLTYRIVKWKTSANWTADEDGYSLWTGN